ncbi:MAG TPA: GntR family transcriptional regulator [Dietzia timorensis]|uniref:GntR family transcriptional regulator n=1 Tax=Dietzia timorensis TaxID=499555 RepID=A0A921JYV4_9ACTN|nr:GntR family transcriptional regulator [Dietzia timorensis]HJE91579.1 GntR family transcriptional regulator [Dietzia timorensis]
MERQTEDTAVVVGRAFASLRPPSTMDAAVSALREAIVRGDIAPGSRLVESALTESMGVSRNTIREVFRLLETERLIEHVTNRGVFVRRLTASDITDVYAVRLLIEVNALRRAGESSARARRATVYEMREAIEAGRTAIREQDKWGLGFADLNFHAAIAGLSESPRLIQFMAGLKTELRLAFAATNDVLDFQHPYVERNQQVYELFLAEDFDGAADELDRYLSEAKADLLDRLERARVTE